MLICFTKQEIEYLHALVDLDNGAQLEDWADKVGRDWEIDQELSESVLEKLIKSVKFYENEEWNKE